MTRLSFALFCWRNERMVGARLVGGTYEAIAATAEKAQSQIAEQLARDEQTRALLDCVLDDPADRIVNVEVRPVLESGGRRYPLPRADVAVRVVTGRAHSGHRQCFLPEIEVGFRYPSDGELVDLVHHFVRQHFAQQPVSALHRHLVASGREQWIHAFPVSVRDASVRRGPGREESPLVRLAEPVPPLEARKVRRGLRPQSLWGRAGEVQAVVEALGRPASVLLVGRSGSGKSAILAEAARRVHEQSVAAGGAPVRFWRTSPERMASTARFLGEWQARVEELLAAASEETQILWIDDLVALARRGGSGAESSMAAYLLPWIESGRVRLVSEATPQQLDALYRTFGPLVAQVQLIQVAPIGEDDLARVRENYRLSLERGHRIELTDAAMGAATRLVTRFARSESMPGPWLGLIADAAEALRRGQAEREAKHTLDVADVHRTFSRKAGLPEALLRDDVALDRPALEAFLTHRVRGQPAALACAMRVIAAAKTGMNDPDKPIATLLFAGPTGVGKTASAIALAEWFFGQREGEAGAALPALVRIDMSEYRTSWQLSRLLGQGDRPGKLIAGVRARPFTVVLFDEVEKAHPVFFDVLMNLLDEGEIRDLDGRLTDFRNTIVVMTTNLGSARRSIGFSEGPAFDGAAVRRHFRPEFVNRIDEIVPFVPLPPDVIHAIAGRELAAVGRRQGVVERRIALVFDDAVVRQVADAGFHPEFGARPLLRAIERLVVAPLAEFLLGDPSIRDVTLRVSWVDRRVAIDLG